MMRRTLLALRSKKGGRHKKHGGPHHGSQSASAAKGEVPQPKVPAYVAKHHGRPKAALWARAALFHDLMGAADDAAACRKVATVFAVGAAGPAVEALPLPAVLDDAAIHVVAAADTAEFVQKVYGFGERPAVAWGRMVHDCHRYNRAPFATLHGGVTTASHLLHQCELTAAHAALEQDGVKGFTVKRPMAASPPHFTSWLKSITEPPHAWRYGCTYHDHRYTALAPAASEALATAVTAAADSVNCDVRLVAAPAHICGAQPSDITCLLVPRNASGKVALRGDGDAIASFRSGLDFALGDATELAARSQRSGELFCTVAGQCVLVRSCMMCDHEGTPVPAAVGAAELYAGASPLMRRVFSAAGASRQLKLSMFGLRGEKGVVPTATTAEARAALGLAPQA